MYILIYMFTQYSFVQDVKTFSSYVFTDCGKNETIAHGQIDFTNADTTYGQSVPVTCDTGYKLFGGHTIQCLADGQWSKTVRCDIKGEVLPWCSIISIN